MRKSTSSLKSLEVKLVKDDQSARTVSIRKESIRLAQLRKQELPKVDIDDVEL